MHLPVKRLGVFSKELPHFLGKSEAQLHGVLLSVG